MAKTPPDTGANSLFLAGEIHALFAFAQALARTSPNPSLLLAHFRGAEQAGLAAVETQPVPDDLVEGYQFVTERLRASLESVVATATDPHKA
jgi:hypothetical protein